jgi:hypothetical protein
MLSPSRGNMRSNSPQQSISQVWRAAIIGTIAALPTTVIINWFPNSEASIGGGVMLFGSIIAGAIATNRSVKPSAAGLRGGLLGGVFAVAVFLVVEGTTLTWSLKLTVFFFIAVVMLLCGSLVFGMIFGRIGGWIANTVTGSRAGQPS